MNEEHHVPEMNGGDHHIPGSSFSCLVKVELLSFLHEMHSIQSFFSMVYGLNYSLQVYDMPESQVKLNDVSEFIGVYTFDPELAAPSDNSDDIMFDLMEDVTAQLPPSKVHASKVHTT